ncbi:MAG: type II secretion system protein [Candidatus Marinimicrobia bacterium CG08_land_8_20_14_0_20_45_22]|nr:MAG: type II secretion system protein [Candidatus Marinimicrobia bacterium CG08_land_8_20_14_0_20_45_22]
MEIFRYTAIGLKGNRIQGVIEAVNKKEAKKALDQLAEKRKVKIESIQQKATFIYTVKKTGQPTLNGEQKAFSKDELVQVFKRFGYEKIRVQKKWFDFKGKVPANEVTSWIRLCADLLKENLPYDEILTLLSEDTANKCLRETIKSISQDLKEGKEGTEVFAKHEDVFGKFPAFMLAVASTSGNMQTIYESTAKFMERDEAFKRNLRKTLVTPFITLGVILLVVVYYVMVIFPQTAGVFKKFGKTLPPMTAATMRFSDYLAAHWIVILLCIIIPVGSLVYFLKTPKGKYLKDKYIIKMPAIGELIHKTSIEIFARVFYSLYSGSGENVKVIQVASEACRNSYMERQIKEVAIPLMLGEGKGIVEAMEASNVFTRTAISRFRSGAESGALRNNALQLANYYETDTSYRMEKVINLVNFIVTMFIMGVMIGITVVSSETSVM